MIKYSVKKVMLTVRAHFLKSAMLYSVIIRLYLNGVIINYF